MELEFDRKGLRHLKPLLREVQTQEQTQELRLTEGMPDLGKILGAWGQVILRGKEWRSDTVACSGGVMVFVLYAPEDGSEMRTLESWIPFQMKWDLDDAHREGEIRIQCLLRFLDARSVSPRKIMLRCGISALGEAFREDTAMLSVPGELPPDIQLLKNRYPIRIPKAAGEKTFQFDEVLGLPASASDPRKLIAYTLEPRISECRIMSGKLVFRGSGAMHVVYLSEDGRVESQELEIPISQFSELEGEYSSDAQGDIRMGVTSLELDMDDENKLRLKAGLLAQYTVDDREMLEIVEDAYSPDRTVEPKLEELELPYILEQKQVAVPVRQTIRQSAREIADVTYLPDFPNQRRGDGVQLELPGQFQVLYYDENGQLGSANARTEENWDMPAGEGTRTEATVLPGAAAGAVPGSGIELKGESVLQTTTVSRRGMPMVTGVNLGEQTAKDSARPSVILRRAGNARLWEIAKSTGSTVEAIRQANALDGEPEISQILLIPVN